ncbi:MAG: sugar ABC transporter substrate-binding protein [Acidimicrobiales bacterium]
MFQRFSRIPGMVKVLTAGALALTSAVVVTSTSSASPTPKTIKNCTVGFSDPTAGNTYLANSEAGAAATLAKHGCKLVTLEADYSVTTEISNIQTFMTKKVNALIIWPEETSADASVLTQAANAGIPVIGYAAYPKTPAGTPPPAPFTGQYLDAHASINFIKQRFEYLKANLPGGKGEVAYIGYGEPVAELDQDYTLTLQVAKEFPGIKIVDRVNDASDDIAGAVSPAAAVLTKYPKLAAFLCYNDPSAIGAASAVKAAGLSGKVLILGEELDKAGVAAIKNGEINSSWDFSAYNAAGSNLGTLAWESINHEAAAKTTIVGPFTLYSKANIGMLTASEMSHL